MNGEREAQRTHRLEVKGTVIKERMKKLSSVTLAFHQSLSLRHVHIVCSKSLTLLLLVVNNVPSVSGLSVSKPGRTEILLEQQASWFIGGSIWLLVGQAGYALFNID